MWLRVVRMQNTYGGGKMTGAELTDGHCGSVAGEEETKLVSSLKDVIMVLN
jgi:hypothetical protein